MKTNLKAPSRSHKADLNRLGEIRTVTGRIVTPLALLPEMISLEDIAHGLSRICRFNGHVEGFLSVAEHSVDVSLMELTDEDIAAFGVLWNEDVERKLRRTFLFHDAAEAYMGDVPSPLKKLPVMEFFRDAEEQNHEVIAQVFDCYYPHPASVHRVDKAQLLHEIAYKRSVKVGLAPDEAKELFLARYEELA